MSILYRTCMLTLVASLGLLGTSSSAQESLPFGQAEARGVQAPASANPVQPAQAYERVGKQIYPQKPAGRATPSRGLSSPWIERFLRRRKKSPQEAQDTTATEPRVPQPLPQPLPQPVRTKQIAKQPVRGPQPTTPSFGTYGSRSQQPTSRSPQTTRQEYRIRSGLPSEGANRVAQVPAALAPVQPESNTPPSVSRVPLPETSRKFQEHAAQMQQPSPTASSRSQASTAKEEPANRQPVQNGTSVRSDSDLPSPTITSRQRRVESNLNQPKTLIPTDEELTPSAPQGKDLTAASDTPSSTQTATKEEPSTYRETPTKPVASSTNAPTTLAVQQKPADAAPSTVSVPTQLTAAPMVERAAEKESQTRPRTSGAPATRLYGLETPNVARTPVPTQAGSTSQQASDPQPNVAELRPQAGPVSVDDLASQDPLESELPPLPETKTEAPSTAFSANAPQSQVLPDLPAMPALPAPSVPTSDTLPSAPVEPILTEQPAQAKPPAAQKPTPEPVAAPAVTNGLRETATLPPAPSETRIAPSLASESPVPSENSLPTRAATTPQVATPPVPKEKVARTPNERFRMQNPGVHVLLEGPSNVAIGTQAEYKVRVVNTDELDLDGLLLRLELPAGIVVTPKQPTHGEMDMERAPDGSVMLTWGLEKLISGQTASAPLNILAQTANDFSVGVEWTLVPLAKSASVHVMSPNLQISMEGPDDVVSGEKNTYRLVVSNQGETTANNVVVNLGAKEFGSTSSKLGNIPAGSERDVEIEMQFKERGSIDITAMATGQGNLKADTQMKIRVRQPRLVAEIIAPKMVYHGSATTYTVRIRNEGDAPAKGLTGKLMLPSGSRPNNLPYDSTYQEGQLAWPIQALAAGGSAEFEFKINLAHEGENSLDLVFGDQLGNAAQAQVITLVRSIADLKLVVNDPVAPAPVGNEVVYQLTLTNRGSKAARDVKVIAQFSDGIEPTRGAGHGYRVVPGQLYFEPIDSISAGETVTLRVFAQAEGQGMHRFRTEVRADAGIRLTQEESTEFLADQNQIATQQSTLKLEPTIR